MNFFILFFTYNIEANRISFYEKCDLKNLYCKKYNNYDFLLAETII